MLLMEISFRKKILAGGFPETANLFPIHFPAYVRRKKSKETSQEGSDKWMMMMMISLASKKTKTTPSCIAHEKKQTGKLSQPNNKNKTYMCDFSKSSHKKWGPDAPNIYQSNIGAMGWCYLDVKSYFVEPPPNHQQHSTKSPPKSTYTQK